MFVIDKPLLLSLLPASCYLICFIKREGILQNPYRDIFATFISHIAGASVGKEGVGINFSKKISSSVFSMFGKKDYDKHINIDSDSIAISAAFSSLFVSPFSGVLFAFETKKKLNRLDVLFSIFSSVMCFYLSMLLKVHPLRFIKISLDDFSNIKNISIALLSVLFVYSLVKLYRALCNYFERWANEDDYACNLSFIIIIVSYIIYKYTGTRHLNSLSSILLNSASEYDIRIISFYLFGKIILTSMSKASRFKGGEFVPLLVVGLFAGFFISNIFGVSSPVILSFSTLSALAFGLKAPLTAFGLFLELLMFSYL